MRERRTLVIVAVALAVLAALPVLSVVARGIAPGAGATWSHLADTVLARYVFNTAVLVVLVGAGVAFGGTLTGWALAQYRFPGSAFFEWALLLPLAMPAYVMAYAYTDLLQYAGPVQTALREAFGWSRGDYWFPDVRSLPGAATMFVFALYPYVYLLARTAFVERPAAFVEAARTLGMDRRRAFWRVELPLARPAIAGGIALALMETLADFGTVAYFAVDTFTTGIYRAWFSLGDRAAAAQLAAALLGFVLIAIALERASRGAARSIGVGRMRAPSGDSRPWLGGWRGATLAALCTVPLVVGFALPVALLARLVHAEPEVAVTARFVEWAWNSLRVAGVAAAISVIFAVLVAYAIRLAPGPLPRAAARVLALGYAVPGTVLAVGVLLPLGMLDGWIADAMRRMTGLNPGLLLTGTTVALIYAYLVRYFAVAWNGIEPGFARITPAMDTAARSLGAGAGETFRRVHAPLLTRTAAAALLLVFVDVMKELPATLVLRPFNFDTLATQAYAFARDERLAEAALPSLAIVAVGLIPILALSRASRRTGSGTAFLRDREVPRGRASERQP
ncbi:Putative 2-aminoethylphosphonate transport system permease protein PhnV [Burkholderiales bacterium]|nr:Putative 2-aminoethylphosphonate transport system permease protein PhnV [Burkholderiales bacterium]